VLSRFQQQSGITVKYIGGREVPAALARAVDVGKPPDVAVLSNPASFQDYVDRHKLKPLNNVLDPQRMKAQYPDSWL
jgi:alpha-glucoside transport system substrate-binding protein